MLFCWSLLCESFVTCCLTFKPRLINENITCVTTCSEYLLTGPSAVLQCVEGTYLKPKYSIWSQIHAKTSNKIMVGKAKENQEAKLMILPLLGKSL